MSLNLFSATTPNNLPSDLECSPTECEELHEVLVWAWVGVEEERRGHHARRERADVSEIRAAVVMVVQLEMFG